MTTANATAQPDASPPLADGRYRLVSVLGRGGMATVYLGFDTRLQIWRAVKVLNPALAASSVIRERFQREARTMVRIRHPNVVAVHELDQDGNRLYIVMELLAGGSVQHHMHKHGPMPGRQAASIIADVLRGLGAVHANHVVHRDVKPANVLLDADGTPKIGDFGIARLSDEDHPGITRSGAAVGTWAFMAPEQKRNSRVVDGRADLYAAGASLFAMLTRQEPHDLDREDVHAETMEGIPACLREIISRATRYRVEERYLTTDEMRDALEAAILELPPSPQSAALPLVLPLPNAPPPPAAVPAGPGSPTARDAPNAERLAAFPDTQFSDRPHSAESDGRAGLTSADPMLLDEFHPTLGVRRWGGPLLGLLLVGVIVFLVGPFDGARPAGRITAQTPEDALSAFAEPEIGNTGIVILPKRTETIAALAPRAPRTEGDTQPPALPVTVPEAPPGGLRLEIRGETCDIWIDGLKRRESFGKITRTITLPSGTHTVRCKTARGRSVDTSVVVPAGGIHSLCLDVTTQRECASG